MTVILTYVNVSPGIADGRDGFDQGTYSMAMALMAMISGGLLLNAVRLSLFNPAPTLTSGAVSGGRRDAEPRHRQAVTLIGLGMICASFRWVRRRDEPGAGAVHAARGRRQLGPRHRAGVRIHRMDLARRHHRTSAMNMLIGYSTMLRAA